MSILDLQVGNIIDIEGALYTVIDIEVGYNKVIVKLQDIESKEFIEKTYNSFSEITIVDIIDKKLQFSYKDNKLYYFIDVETYEQLAVTEEMIQTVMNYIVEDSIVTMRFVRDKLIEVILPEVVELVVAELEDENSNKHMAILETGLKITVPKEIKIGDKIRINTITNKFVNE